MSDTDDLVDALVPVVAAFRELGVRHFVGGSIASSFHGATRATMDVDLNLIHLPTSFKVDVFVSRGRPFDHESMRRATIERIGESRTVDVPIASVEDSIVSKLEWYRLTNETSERQWDDVSRLIRLLGEKADRDYLRRAATSVGVSDLLERLLD